MIQILGGMGGGGGEDTLNKELSARSDDGNVFSTPFGDKTIFHTKEGRRIMLMFTFDPDRPYDSSYQMASITNDYMAAVRRGLTKLLLGVDAKRPTEQETIWTHLKNTLSSSAFTELLKQDTRRMHEYVEMVSKEARLDYAEEQKLTAAMSTQTFKFRFDIAIDAYPVKIKSGSNKGIPPGRKGVLSFFIQSLEAEAKEQAESKASPVATDSSSSSSSSSMDTDTKSTTEAGDATSKKRPRSKDTDTEPATKKYRRGASPKRSVVRNNDSQKQWKSLSKRLALVEDEEWSLCHIKPFDTAYDFFDASDKWFLGCVKALAERLQHKKRNANAGHLYN